jgi:hypothetical protein
LTHGNPDNYDVGFIFGGHGTPERP